MTLIPQFRQMRLKRAAGLEHRMPVEWKANSRRSSAQSTHCSTRPPKPLSQNAGHLSGLLRASHKPLTDAPRTDGIRRDWAEPKTQKTLVKRDFALAAGTGRDPDLRVRIPLGLNRRPLFYRGFFAHPRLASAVALTNLSQTLRHESLERRRLEAPENLSQRDHNSDSVTGCSIRGRKRDASLHHRGIGPNLRQSRSHRAPAPPSDGKQCVTRGCQSLWVGRGRGRRLRRPHSFQTRDIEVSCSSSS